MMNVQAGHHVVHLPLAAAQGLNDLRRVRSATVWKVSS
jgi:hypothetical protein